MKALDYFLIGFLVLLLVGGFLYFQFIKSEGAKCLDDPLGFAERVTGDNTACYCIGSSASGGIINFHSKSNNGS